MKLLIDVDEELVCKGFEQPLTEEERDILIRAIGNGKSYEERPKGEWKLHGMIYYCSECGHECGESGDNYCGNCGTDMRGAE